MRQQSFPVVCFVSALSLLAGLCAQQAGGDAAPRPVAVRAGALHPVSGPAIADGVIVIENGRITALGAADQVAIPAEALVLDHRQHHVYPGLVDALTDAYTDPALRGDGALDAASAVHGTLQRRGDREDDLVRHGVTTAYIAVRNQASWRGQGAIVRPRADGFAILQPAAAVQLRATNGPQPSHALQRQQQIQALFAAFDGLDQYRKSFEEHDKALEKYNKDFAEYLAFHERKKNESAPAEGGQRRPAQPPGEAAPGAGNGAGAAEAPGGAQGRPRRRPGGQGQPPEGTPPDQAPPAPPAAPARPAAQPGEAAAQAADKPPERPKYPKAPARDPQKDALLDVLDGKLPLRVEAHRADEIQTVLQLAAEKKVPLLVLENALDATALAADLARSGIPVVMAGLWPEPLPPLYGSMDPLGLPARLHQAGAAVAIASGRARNALALPLAAALAASRGLDEAAALRAITLTPAEILGVQRDVGSLQVGKLGDLIVTDRPLFLSDCRILRVLAGGEIQYEAK